MNRSIRCSILVAVFGAAEGAGLGTPADAVNFTVDARRSLLEIPADFIGLSYETKQLLPDEKGRHYFSAENKPLIALFRMLGVASLRIGGNSVDTPEVPVPATADLDSLFAFAKSAGVKVIYSVRLKDGNRTSAAATARYIHSHYADLIDCFAIGNEPGYYKPYDVYRPKWAEIMTAIVAVFPEAKFCGPDDNVNPILCRNMVRDFGAPRSADDDHSTQLSCGFCVSKPETHDADQGSDSRIARDRAGEIAVGGAHQRLRKSEKKLRGCSRGNRSLLPFVRNE